MRRMIVFDSLEVSGPWLTLRSLDPLTARLDIPGSMVVSEVFAGPLPSVFRNRS